MQENIKKTEKIREREESRFDKKEKNQGVCKRERKWKEGSIGDRKGKEDKSNKTERRKVGQMIKKWKAGQTRKEGKVTERKRKRKARRLDMKEGKEIMANKREYSEYGRKEGKLDERWRVRKAG